MLKILFRIEGACKGLNWLIEEVLFWGMEVDANVGGSVALQMLVGTPCHKH